jgi:hypothetical protein
MRISEKATELVKSQVAICKQAEMRLRDIVNTIGITMEIPENYVFDFKTYEFIEKPKTEQAQ